MTFFARNFHPGSFGEMIQFNGYVRFEISTITTYWCSGAAMICLFLIFLIHEGLHFGPLVGSVYRVFLLLLKCLKKGVTWKFSVQSFAKQKKCLDQNWKFGCLDLGWKTSPPPKKVPSLKTNSEVLAHENQCLESMIHIFSGIGFLLLDSGSVIHEKKPWHTAWFVGESPYTKSLRVRGKKSA